MVGCSLAGGVDLVLSNQLWSMPLDPATGSSVPQFASREEGPQGPFEDLRSVESVWSALLL